MSDEDLDHLTDGWGDEDDLELDDENEIENEQQNDNNYEEEEEEEVVFHSTTTLPSTSAPSHQRSSTATRTILESVDADKEENLEFAEDLENTNHTPLDAWDFDEDDSVRDDRDDEQMRMTSTPSSKLPAPPRPLTISTTTDTDNDNDNRLYQELDVYVSQHLELLWSSINAILQAEYNTPDHAEHLVQYYQQRPQLATYTLEKELQRMSYHVHIGSTGGGGAGGASNAVLTDPKQIAEYFIKHHHLPATTSATTTNTNSNHTIVVDWNQILLGASNQSLLADLLHVMTGPDRLIRPQYFTTCMATQCRFQMNLTQSAVVVTCHADFEMSLPCHATTATTSSSSNPTSSSSSSSSSRLVVATFAADITFQPSLSMIHYQITKLDVVLNQHPHKEQALRSVASFLKEMMGDDHDLMAMMGSPSNNNNYNNNMTDNQNDESSADMFRDIFFLEQTQDFIKSQQLGIQTAWNQMGAVVNLQSKLETVTNLLSSGQEAFMSATAAAAAASASMDPTLPHEEQEEEEEEEISFGVAPPHRPPGNDHSGPRLASSHHTRPSVPPLNNAFNARPPPPQGSCPEAPAPPPPRPPPQPPTHATRTAPPPNATLTSDRPISILGGFISRLAQSVTNIPDEEDIYRNEYGFSTTTDTSSSVAANSSDIPQLYRRENPPHAHNRQPRQHHEQQQEYHPLPGPPSLGYPQPPPPPAAVPNRPWKKQPPLPAKAPPLQSFQQTTQPAPSLQSHPNEDVVVQDGWDDIDDVENELVFENDDDDDDKNESTFATDPPSTTTTKASIDESRGSIFTPHLVPTSSNYNPEDDIIEPRKRWVNPRPGLRRIIP